MSSLLEYVRLAARERGSRSMLPRKLSPVKTDMSLTDPASHVDPNEPDTATPRKPPRPTTIPDERVWRDGQHAMTYNAWLANEKELDDAFRIWRDTDDGRREVAEVYNRFPGLRLTSMGAEDVSWFVREMSTPDTYLRKTWDAASSDENTKPGFTLAQLMLLMLLTSPQRSLEIDAMYQKSEELFPFYREAPWWGKLYGPFAVGGPGLTGDYDCLFPHWGYLEGKIPGWPSRSECAASGIDSFYTLPPGEENLLTTDRYGNEPLPLYCDAPPYISESRVYGGMVAKGIFDLPQELLNKIFKHLGLFEGPVLMALDDTRLDDLPKAFRCRFVLPINRTHIRGVGRDWDKDARPHTSIPEILGLRKVCRVWGEMVQDVFFQNTFVFRYDNHMPKDSMSQNVWAISTSVREDRYNLVDFKVHCEPNSKNRLAQRFEIGFDYEEEVVHLGASRNTGRMIFGTDAPCHRTFVKKWINNQLFLDDGGHLAVRAFRLKFDPGTHGRELSRQWLSDIFQHLHKRGVSRKIDSKTLLLDWDARAL
ncbi:hypothetical protein J4E93_001506 [Alternaria ventricosa]|uniref:uncharacterized protein n=1 Tax=Alternaria ventricosa TaxID=1187951 RepID=UPI0020C2F561|nr:uncharacterized protein J4E93_001506 [Alternaria ventricosa]KAI4653739.1 hypothetical protein J4E93_001506 [Alternaria ventricosa]